MNKTLLYFKTWMKATGRNLVSAKVLSLVVLLSAVPYAAFSGNGSLSEVSESMQAGTQTVSGTVQDQDGTPWSDGYFESVERRGDRRER